MKYRESFCIVKKYRAGGRCLTFLASFESRKEVVKWWTRHVASGADGYILPLCVDRQYARTWNCPLNFQTLSLPHRNPLLRSQSTDPSSHLQIVSIVAFTFLIPIYFLTSYTVLYCRESIVVVRKSNLILLCKYPVWGPMSSKYFTKYQPLCL